MEPFAPKIYPATLVHCVRRMAAPSLSPQQTLTLDGGSHTILSHALSDRSLESKRVVLANPTFLIA